MEPDRLKTKSHACAGRVDRAVSGIMDDGARIGLQPDAMTL
jgi:hypothetical protein